MKFNFCTTFLSCQGAMKDERGQKKTETKVTNTHAYIETDT